MANPGVANSSVTNLMPVQATFNTAGVCTGLIGPGGVVFSPPLSGNTENPSTLSMGGNLVMSATAPTIASGFGTSPTITGVNTAAFKVTVGSGGAGSGVITLPAAPNGWVVYAQDITTASIFLQQTGSTTTSATLTSYSITTGLAANMTAGDAILMIAMAY